MLGEPPPERLDRAADAVKVVEAVGGERVHRVLHRVGGDHEPVVAVRVRRVEVALEGDRHGEVANGMALGPADQPDEPDRLLAVAVVADLDDAHRCFSQRSAAMSTMASSARAISVDRSAANAASIAGMSAARGRPATKTQ